MRTWLLGILFAVGGCAAPNGWQLSEGQHAERLQRTVSVAVDADLLLYLPPGFDATGGKRYPLLIFLHGSGESGRNVELVKLHGPPMFVAGGGSLPFMMAAPQAHQGRQGFDVTMLNAVLDALIERLPVDTDRVYLTGLSMGGEWSYAWASMNPERFAAIAPVSGAWDPEVACALARVPVWAFHGAKDDVIPVADDRAMIDAINRCGGHAKISVYPEIGHDAWNAAYADPELVAWLMAQTRRDSPR